MNIINILGVNISTLNKQQILEKLNQFLTDGKQHQIVTPNPEILLQAGHDEEFFYILNKADLAIPDGIGLKFAGWLAGKNIHRITGADLIGDILKIAEQKNLKVAVVNWKNGLSKKEDIEKVLQKKYPDLKFIVKDIERFNGTHSCLPRCALARGSGTQPGVRGRGIPAFARLAEAPAKRAGMTRSEDSHIDRDESLQQFQPDILIATLGAPWQEKFIYHNLSQLPSVKIGIGVGGAFDFLTGKIKRAPKFMRVIGLEWLWRLFKQPWRWKRIYNAVIVFPWQFFKWKFVLTFLYRPNVSCILYKKDGNRIKILLVERKDDPGHWQLPQGGTDGENIETAGKRELREEIGTDKFKPVCSYSNLWKYKFGIQSSNGIKKRLIKGYKGQKQGLFIAEFTGRDEDIKINFWEHINWKWVDSENLVNEVHQVRKEAAKIFLEKFKSSSDCPKITSLSFPT